MIDGKNKQHFSFYFPRFTSARHSTKRWTIWTSPAKIAPENSPQNTLTPCLLKTRSIYSPKKMEHCCWLRNIMVKKNRDVLQLLLSFKGSVLSFNIIILCSMFYFIKMVIILLHSLWPPPPRKKKKKTQQPPWVPKKIKGQSKMTKTWSHVESQTLLIQESMLM